MERARIGVVSFDYYIDVIGGRAAAGRHQS